LTITFVDAGVLISAARGISGNSRSALTILDDPNRFFVSSMFVPLEVLPKASFYQRVDERDFYETFFRKVERWAPVGKELLEGAFRVASDNGLSAIDALHVAAALVVGADELITTEKPTKPIHRVKGVPLRVVYLPS
jgi:predicted nucleic acid-binding protein